MKKLNATEMRQVEGGKYKCGSCSYSTGFIIAISFHVICNGHLGYTDKCMGKKIPTVITPCGATFYLLQKESIA